MMKHKFYLLIAITFLFTTSLLAQDPTTDNIEAVASNIQLATIEIEGMACQEGCADAINKNLEAANGVLTTEVSYENKKAIISFDAQLISATTIQKIITDTKVKDYQYSIKNITIK
jgi:copper chaperone CopZ